MGIIIQINSGGRFKCPFASGYSKHSFVATMMALFFRWVFSAFVVSSFCQKFTQLILAVSVICGANKFVLFKGILFLLWAKKRKASLLLKTSQERKKKKKKKLLPPHKNVILHKKFELLHKCTKNGYLTATNFHSKSSLLWLLLKTAPKFNEV